MVALIRQLNATVGRQIHMPSTNINNTFQILPTSRSYGAENLNSDFTTAMTPATTSETNVTVEENTIPKDSATLKTKEDSIIKEHGHKH